jgi:hypothetical protein
MPAAPVDVPAVIPMGIRFDLSEPQPNAAQEMAVNPATDRTSFWIFTKFLAGQNMATYWRPLLLAMPQNRTHIQRHD